VHVQPMLSHCKHPNDAKNLSTYCHVPVAVFLPLGGGEGEEGPRSRCYVRTAALRLIVQPYEEDEEKDD
jgi:hypothetical protein